MRIVVDRLAVQDDGVFDGGFGELHQWNHGYAAEGALDPDGADPVKVHAFLGEAFFFVAEA